VRSEDFASCRCRTARLTTSHWPLTTFPQPFFLIPKARIKCLTSLGIIHSPTSWTHAGSMEATCANPQCGNRFEPKQRKHIYCSERCRWAVVNTRTHVFTVIRLSGCCDSILATRQAGADLTFREFTRFTAVLKVNAPDLQQFTSTFARADVGFRMPEGRLYKLGHYSEKGSFVLVSRSVVG
jgi:hypothetical protein